MDIPPYEPLPQRKTKYNTVNFDASTQTKDNKNKMEDPWKNDTDTSMWHENNEDMMECEDSVQNERKKNDPQHENVKPQEKKTSDIKKDNSAQVSEISSLLDKIHL